MSKTVCIEWLASKWLGVQEEVPVGRVKTKGPFDIGQEIKVSYDLQVRSFQGKSSERQWRQVVL